MSENTPSTPTIARRAGGVLFGCLTQALFLFTVWHLFWFLKDGSRPSPDGSLVWDLVLAIQFAVPHSVLLLPVVKKRLLAYISAPFYGSFYCVATCLSLLAVIFFWQLCEPVLWEFDGVAKRLVQTGFAASWLGLFYSLSLTGLGYQTGLTEWVTWLRRQPQRRRVFRRRGAYQYLRHPVYLSFLGLIWFTPRMSLDHALLTGVWTAYIFIGSVLKDGRLAYYLGREYREYAERVAGYPLIRFGPLARWPSECEAEKPSSHPHLPQTSRAA